MLKTFQDYQNILPSSMENFRKPYMSIFPHKFGNFVATDTAIDCNIYATST